MKKLAVAVGSYEKDGQKKTKWKNIGILNVNKNGKEYILLDPGESLAGLLIQQNIAAMAEGKTPSQNVMVNIFDDNQQQQQGFNQSATQQQQQGFNQQQAPQQQGVFQKGVQNNQGSTSAAADGFDDDIPF